VRARVSLGVFEGAVIVRGEAVLLYFPHGNATGAGVAVRGVSAAVLLDCCGAKYLCCLYRDGYGLTQRSDVEVARWYRKVAGQVYT